MAKAKRILIVEDDQFLVKVYTTKLSKEGFEIQMAINGEEVAAKVKNFKPNLILLDIMLPGQNGFEILEALKKSPTTKKIPVIILSNLGQDSDVQKGIELGAADYFVKTNLSINDVVSKIKSAMK